jgi:hypothetical protein
MRSVRLSLLLMLFAAAAHAQTVKILVQSSPLAGFQYYAGEALWSQMREGDKLELVREPGNEHDAHAVRVEWRGIKLGYLPRAQNRAVADEMDRGGNVAGRIARLSPERNPWRRLLIEVFVLI